MRALRVIVVVATVAFAISRVPSIGGSLPLAVTAALIMTVYVVATALLALRTLLVRKRRVAWAMLTTALGCYTAATSYSWAVKAFGGALPFPSVADVGWLLFYPFAFAALVLFIREQVLRSGVKVARLLFDAAVAGFGASALLAAIAIELLIHPVASDASVLETITAFAYPTGDALLLGMALALFMVAGRTGRRDRALLISGLVAVTVGDVGYVALASLDLYQPGHIIDLAYLSGLTLVGLSAWGHTRRQVVTASGQASLVLPIVFGLSSLALLLAATFTPITAISIALAGATLLAVVLHLLGSFREIRNIGLHDPLTGLPNRALIMDRIDDALQNTSHGDSEIVLILGDLDDFKVVNDALGHFAGDQVLCEVARRMRAAVRSRDLVARLGGDEFAILIKAADDAAIATLSDRLIAVVREPVILDTGQPVEVGLSIGVARATVSHGAQTLLRDADATLYHAKRRGKSRTEHFNEELRLNVLERLAVPQELRAALTAGGDELFCLHQPEIDLTTGRLFAFESLVRWQHPERGLLTPDRFVPLAETVGLSGQLFSHVLECTLATQRRWATILGSHPALSVNLSARDLDDASLPGRVAMALTRTETPADLLWLEVTETAIANAGTLRTLQALHDLGVHLAIDDFGTGWSSLNRLADFPFDLLKIDRSFTAKLSPGSKAHHMIRATIVMAHALGMLTVAEGVESRQQLDLLTEMGCDIGQGFHFARPLPASEAITHLASDGTWQHEAAAPPGLVCNATSHTVALPETTP